MKEIYMLCNAHLDPVWQWQRTEGMAEAISTFRVAAKFCEKYDGFVFNHNESVIYEWVEENEPQLFERIKRLVREGKWKIMGGWYLQPDCLMPSGESIIRQIKTGNEYFMEKFGVKPETAINFDPFGHSRGMVQILKKCGYNSYVFMRPYDFVPERDFIWEGYDGSTVVGHCTNGGYNTNKGKVGEKIDRILESAHDGANLMLWGIGDHGGGPSEVDLGIIEEYKKKYPEVRFVHSCCEDYFARVDKAALRTVDSSIVHCMIGCYTSMTRIKHKHRQFENELFMCESMLAASGVDYDEKQMKAAEKAMLFCEFHDVLPGTVIRKAEEDALRQMDYGREILAANMSKAFFALCSGQKEGKSGEIPILVYNPLPYTVEKIVEVEFQLEDQNWNDEYTVAKAYDENGVFLPTQNEKEDGSLNLDWRKKVAFRAKLEPMSINRFDCVLTTLQGGGRPTQACDETDTHFVFENDRLEVAINKTTGLIDRYRVDGVDRINGMKILAYKDNEDPWAMNVDGYYEVKGEFEAVSDKEANEFNGYPGRNYANVRVTDNGDVVLKIQAIMKYSRSYAVVTYVIPKNDTYVDINIKMLSNDTNTVYKLAFDTTMGDADFIGQQMFGREKMIKGEKEVTYQKWCGFFDGERNFVVLNRGTYGGSARENVMNITMMRTPVYLAHPIEDRPITEDNRSHEHIDMGERDFEYRLTADTATPDFDAENYNVQPLAVSFFPSGDGERKNTRVEISNRNIIMTRYAKDGDGLLIRLYNTKGEDTAATIEADGKKFTAKFKPFEIKTYRYDGTAVVECEM